MSTAWVILRNASCLLFSILLLNSCATSEKTAPKTYTVEISQMKFIPAELNVQKGDTVIFINHDMVVHDVTEDPGKAWTSSPLPVGKSWSLVVSGSSDYFCSIHQVMKGKIIVQ
ncbi:MAG: cupredoxin domain-containing protein [Ferruginibacter sp.]